MSFIEEIDFQEIQLHGVVGKGAFGTVRKGKWRNLDVAVKTIETEQEKKAFIIEVQQLSRVNHPNIVRLYGACTKLPVCLVMEYAEGGSLYNVLHCMKEVEYTAAHAMSWLLQCATGVAYLHNMKPRALIHRDLKPPNLLLVMGGTVLKICDFGTACDCHTIMTNSKGSAAWMAPEVFEGSQYSEKCDIFSWAIILWEVLTRKKPFHDGEGATAFGIMWAVHSGKRPPLIQGCPKPIEKLMTRCWSKDPMTRPSMLEVVEELKLLFKFFKGAEKSITCLTPQGSNHSEADESIIITPTPNSETKSNESKTVQFRDNLINMPISSFSINEDDRNPYPSILFSKPLKEDKKRHSADCSNIDMKLPQNLGHRRSGSCDSPCIKRSMEESSDISQKNTNEATVKTSAQDHNKEHIDVHNKNTYMTLEPKLQPLQPIQSSRESVAIFEEHCRMARDFLQKQAEVAALTERKNKLQKQLQDRGDSRTYIEDYLQLKKEQEGLLQLRQNLKRQLEIIRLQQQQGQNSVNNNKQTSDEWVMV